MRTSQLPQPSKEKTERRGPPSAELGAKGMDFQTTLNFGPSVGGPAYIVQVLMVPDVLGLNSTLTESMDTVNLYFYGHFFYNCITICDLYPFIIYITWIILASSV